MKQAFFIALIFGAMPFTLNLLKQRTDTCAASTVRERYIFQARQAQKDGAAAATTTAPSGSRQTAATSNEASAVREIDLEGLKKLLQREAAPKGKPLLINFWATWCGPCREEFPDLVSINSDYRGRNLDFVTITLDDPAEIKTTVRQFLNETHATALSTYLLNVPDADPAIKFVDTTWGGELPATFIFDASGRMVFKHTGRIKPAEVRAALDKLTASGK